MVEVAGLPIGRGLRCRCPRCGEGRLFAGFMAMRPAVFIILFAGFIVVFAALITEVLYQPPFWLHAALWGPLILLVTLAPLRPMKGLLIALQYHHKAQEGRLDPRDRA
jgi:uncharacterized protein (DUF983 family)